MKLNDVKVGMKVVPFKKSIGTISFEEFLKKKSKSVDFFRHNGYLFVVDILNGIITLSVDMFVQSGLYEFRAEDFEPYVEEENNNKNNNKNNSTKKEKIKTKNQVIYIKSLPFIVNYEIKHNEKIEIQSYDGDSLNVKVIVNGTTTIMIDLESGETTVAMLHPDDKFDLQKGIEICFNRLMIKKYTEKLNELVRG